MLLTAHIIGGVLALAAGYLALYAAKGGSVHRQSGMLFVYAMVTLSLTFTAPAGASHRAL